jgi:hypothetical protein
MANTNHRDLTGVALHEPKGIAAAAAGTYYVADGASSGAFEAIMPVAAHYQYQESDGVDGEAFPTSYAAVDLNTEVTDPNSIGTLATKAVTLGAGTYLMIGWVGVSYDGTGSRGARCRIRNTSDNTTVGLGQGWEHVGLASLRTSHQMQVQGIQVITGSKAYELQVMADDTSVKTGRHDTITAGAEVYADLLILKMAN